MKRVIVLALIGLLLVSVALAVGNNVLLTRVYQDARCDGVYDSTDIPLGDATVALVFPDGSFVQQQTRGHGMALFRLSKPATRVALVVLPDSMTPCVAGSDIQEIDVTERFQFIQVGFQPVATGTAGVVLP